MGPLGTGSPRSKSGNPPAPIPFLDCPDVREVLPRVADLGHCTGLPHGAVCKALKPSAEGLRVAEVALGFGIWA